MTRSKIVPFVILLLCAGCLAEDEELSNFPAPQSPALPAAELRDVLSELSARVDAAPPAPSEQRLAQLLDLVETAWVPGHGDARTRAMAARSLGDEDGIDWVLESSLTHEHADVRAEAAALLGERGRRAAIPLIAERLRPIGYEADVRVRCAFVLALAKLGVLGTIDELIDWMRQPDSAQIAGWTAVEVLKACGRDPGESPTYDDLGIAIGDLARVWRATGVPPEEGGLEFTPVADDPLFEARLAAMLTELQGFALRPVDETRFVMTRIGRLGLPLLRDALHAEKPYLRTHALEIVLGLERVARELGPDVLPLLGNELDASLAATTLGSIGADGAFDHLMAMLRSDRLEMRASAAGALGRLGDARAVDALLERIRDEGEVVDVRVQAAFGLALLDPGLRQLEDLLDAEAYHEPTLRELIDEVGTRRR